MITLKHDLKIYVNILLFILLFSCTTTPDEIVIESYSDSRSDISSEVAAEEEIIPLDIEIDDEITVIGNRSDFNLNIEEFDLPLLYSDKKVEFTVIGSYLATNPLEYSLPKLDYSIRPLVAKTTPVKTTAVKTTPVKTTPVKTTPVKTTPVKTTPVKTTPVKTTPVKTTPVKTTPVKTTPVKTTPVKTTPVKTTPVKTTPVIVLDDMQVVSGKSFTIEMDQTGWLYENPINEINFKNKFYTTDKVLFEFYPTEPGNYSIEFSKYKNGEQILSRVNIQVVKVAQNTNVKVANSDKVENIIVPEKIKENLSEKAKLEKELKNIKNSKNPDVVYFKLANIYFEEGLIKKSKEYYEYVYDNYPFSIYYEESRDKMNYIIKNFLKVR